MTVILDSRDDFTLDTLRRVAWQGEPVAFSARCRQMMEQSRASFMTMLESDPDQFVYGVTSGYGHTAGQPLNASGWLNARPIQRAPGLACAHLTGWCGQ